MMAPFFKYGMFGEETSLVVAFLIGIGFGFFLERAGFGSARKLVSQFYLNDLAVFKVMFTAIVTAMLGVTYLGWAGWLDLSLVYLVPTYLGPQVIGGLILGVGFVVGGFMGLPTVTRALYAPMANSTTAVTSTDNHMLVETDQIINGNSGTIEPMIAAKPTTSAARSAVRRSIGAS